MVAIANAATAAMRQVRLTHARMWCSAAMPATLRARPLGPLSNRSRRALHPVLASFDRRRSHVEFRLLGPLDALRDCHPLALVGAKTRGLLDQLSRPPQQEC